MVSAEAELRGPAGWTGPKRREPVKAAGSRSADAGSTSYWRVQRLIHKTRAISPVHAHALDLLLPVPGRISIASQWDRQDQSRYLGRQTCCLGTRHSLPQKSAIRAIEVRNAPGSLDLLTKALAPASRQFAATASSSAQLKMTTGVKYTSGSVRILKRRSRPVIRGRYKSRRTRSNGGAAGRWPPSMPSDSAASSPVWATATSIGLGRRHSENAPQISLACPRSSSTSRTSNGFLPEDRPSSRACNFQTSPAFGKHLIAPYRYGRRRFDPHFDLIPAYPENRDSDVRSNMDRTIPLARQNQHGHSSVTNRPRNKPRCDLRIHSPAQAGQC